MIPTYRYSVSSPISLDLNEEDHSTHHHHFFPSNHNQPSSSSNSSLSYSTIFNPPDHDQPRSCYWDVSKHSQSDQEGERVVPSSVSWDYSPLEKDDVKVKVWKKEDGNCESFQGEEDNSVKWMPSKKRMIRRMMVWDQTSNSDVAGITKKENNYEEQKLPLSPLGNGNSTSNNSSSQSNITVRVCSDCHTTKTPLWRSGPRGPKSLCNACGIRQRKARRAMAAAASANGTVPEATENKSHLKANNKFRCKGKKLKTDQESEPKLKKKRKLNNGAKSSLGNRKKFGFEDLKLSLSKNLALQKVFPQDEKEAAILLMALSYGLLHGFPSHRYLD